MESRKAEKDENEAVETEALLRGQGEIWRLMFGFADSMALKCAVELHLADIIHSYGCPVSLSQIASRIDSDCPHIPYLKRIMRMLVRRGIFTMNDSLDNEETLYGSTQLSRWLLHDWEFSLAPMVIMQNYPAQLEPWHFFSHCVKDGGVAYKKAHGCDIWELASRNPELNRIFNDAMASTANITMKALLSQYKDGFENIQLLVDVGGGTGGTLAEIVKANPHIKAINFDLPHVVATAPVRKGVSHVGGNMFEAIPMADAVFMKWVLHDWGEEECVKILKNCRKAIPEKTGKVILVELVVQPDGNSQFGDMDVVFDLLMFAHSPGGKERTEREWKNILEEGGFPRYQIIKIPTLPSIIEAYPE
ncbi:Methyltransf_2 domain-containing protein/Dimerisation domain-containing protein [Cephalotus follicularis]|uniref:Methyltransf_2 domain-containing protein/Dimerisation domain-containing protein n=1 Tax=Cephalotus follicularis TaxID=3775 RepID=A0A1Q3CP92_CEPFO|nr:Methyltransf_2 domain-containing protein/Dimerisation domain-containing protein [Cephalotus follicularis]